MFRPPFLLISLKDCPVTFINLDLVRRAVLADGEITLFFSESDQVVVRGKNVKEICQRLSERAIGLDGVIFPDLPLEE